jgi:predicted lysophospholipase L1 biosynthesis ABC-type transport system permease subunit
MALGIVVKQEAAVAALNITFHPFSLSRSFIRSLACLVVCFLCALCSGWRALSRSLITQQPRVFVCLSYLAVDARY